MRISLLLLSVIVAVPSFAGPMRLKGGAKSEEKLRQFVSQDAKLKARLADAQRREERFVAEARESNLRDAVSDYSPVALHANPDLTSGEKRKSILESMPGMKAVAGPVCATLAACAKPDMSTVVSDAGNIPDAVRGMVRPWMTLQQARNSEISVVTAEGAGDAVLTINLKGVSAPPLVLNVSPHLLGGFSVWYENPEAAAALYAREREAVLKATP